MCPFYVGSEKEGLDVGTWWLRNILCGNWGAVIIVMYSFISKYIPKIKNSLLVPYYTLNWCLLLFSISDVQPLSPISVHERYSSPMAGSAKRRLFGDESPKAMRTEKNQSEGARLKIAPGSSVADGCVCLSPEQTVVTMPITGTMDQKTTISQHSKLSF